MIPWHQSADGSYIYRQDADRLLVLTEQAQVAERAAQELGCKPCSIQVRGTVFELKALK